MKRINNLFEHIVSIDNLTLALANAKKGKSYYTAVQEIYKHPDDYIQNLQNMLIDHKFVTSEYRIKKIFEPKERDIYILPFYPDRIVHHAIMQVLQPIFDKMFIYDLYSAIPGRGIHMGYNRVKQFLKDHENTQYCLKFDIRKFYPSINNNILYQQICNKIKCKETLWLLRDIIYSNGGETNLPIGNYLSQYLSNLYMNKFDHWLKEDMHIKYYARYCDDGVIFDKDKEFLKYLLEDIDQYLINNLKLNLNPKTRIVNVDAQGIDFLGYRMFREYSLLRKSSVRTIKYKINMFETHSEQYSPSHIISSIMSIYGWAIHCNSHNLLTKYLFENKKINEIVKDCSDQLKISNPLEKIINCNKKQYNNNNYKNKKGGVT
jgi:hypothetical protein